MARFFSHTPRKGKPIALKGLAEGLANLEKAWENLIVIGGKLTWASDGITPVIDLEAGAGAKIESCWSIAKFTLDTIELAHCYFMRGPITVLHEGKLSASLSGTGKKVVVALINLKDHSITLFAGDADILRHLTPAEQSEMYALPLYMLDRTGADSLWQVVCDMRSIPQLGVMI